MELPTHGQFFFLTIRVRIHFILVNRKSVNESEIFCQMKIEQKNCHFEIRDYCDVKKIKNVFRTSKVIFLIHILKYNSPKLIFYRSPTFSSKRLSQRKN